MHSVGTYLETSSNTTHLEAFSQSSQFAETDPGIKSGISVHELISTLKKKVQAGNELSNIFSKSSHARKKPPPKSHHHRFSSRSCGGGSGGFFLACKDFGRMFDYSFPTCTFFFKVEISLRTLIPLFRPGSVHSGSAGWDDCDQVFLTSFMWARFLISSHPMPGQWFSQTTPTSLGQRCMHV